jgi:hypothetical protein
MVEKEFKAFIEECKFKQTLNIKYEPCKFINRHFVAYHKDGTFHISGKVFNEKDIQAGIDRLLERRQH